MLQLNVPNEKMEVISPVAVQLSDQENEFNGMGIRSIRSWYGVRITKRNVVPAVVMKQ
jgi:hypothetical protein